MPFLKKNCKTFIMKKSCSSLEIRTHLYKISAGPNVAVVEGIRVSLCFRNSRRFISESSSYNRLLSIGTVVPTNTISKSSLLLTIHGEPTFDRHWQFRFTLAMLEISHIMPLFNKTTELFLL